MKRLLLLLVACGTPEVIEDEPLEDPCMAEDGTAIEMGTWYRDADGDGFGDPAAAFEACIAPANTVSNRLDCDDTDALVSPDAEERCNRRDDDCDGNTDEGLGQEWFVDRDGDGYGTPDETVTACELPDGASATDDDCDDDDEFSHPGGVELCDWTDNNCDGEIDEGAEPLTDVHDACDGRDADCDGEIDEDARADWILVSLDTSAGTVFEVDRYTAASVPLAAITDGSATVNTMDVRENGRGVCQDNTGQQLMEVDACTGDLRGMGRHGVGNTCGIAFGPNGVLYGLDSTNDQLVRFDPAGNGTVVGSLGISLGNCGLAYDCTTQRLIGADATTDRLFTVDPATGATSNFVQTAVPFASVGLEYDPARRLVYAATGTDMYTVDPTTGDTTYVGSLGGQNIDDLALHPACSSP